MHTTYMLLIRSQTQYIVIMYDTLCYLIWNWLVVMTVCGGGVSVNIYYVVLLIGFWIRIADVAGNFYLYRFICAQRRKMWWGHSFNIYVYICHNMRLWAGYHIHFSSSFYYLLRTNWRFYIFLWNPFKPDNVFLPSIILSHLEVLFVN